MTAILIPVIAALTGAVGMLITLFEWARTRVTLRRAEENTRESAKSLLTQDINIDLVRGPQADIDARQTTAVAEVLKALESTENAVIQIGTTLVVKVSGTVTVQELDTKELRYLERHQELMRSPEAMLTALSDPNTPFSSGRVMPQPGAD
jgi:hypothetical protein